MARILIITLATVALVAAFASAQRQTTPDDSGDTYDIEDERCKFGAKDRNKEFVNEKGHKCTCKAQWWGQNARCVRRVRTTTTTVPTTTTTTTTTTVPTTSTESTTTTTAATTQKPNTYVEKRSNCTNDKEGQEYVNEDGDRCKCERMFSPVHGYNARCTRTKNGTNEATTSAGTTTTTTAAPTTTRTTTVPTTRKTTVKPDNYRENNKNCSGFNTTKGEFVNKEGDKCRCLPFSLFRHYNTQCTRNRTNNSTTTTIAPTTTTAPETTTTTEEPATTTTTTEAVTTTTTEEAVTTTTTEEAVTTTTTEEAVTTTTEEAVTTTTEAAPTTTTEEIITAETSISE